jgi:predicted nucleic acid-binding protein
MIRWHGSGKSARTGHCRGGTEMVLDTNILIYAAKPSGEHLRPWLEDAGATVSIITRIEALGFPGITSEEEAAIEGALQSLPRRD